MRKALFIVGPTASGKTDLGLELASQFNGSIVSADSVQVYRGLDIISGKDAGKEFKIQSFDFTRDKNSILRFHSGQEFKIDKPEITFGYYQIGIVKVYLLDLVSPTYNFNVSDFISIASPVINEISSNGFLPIIVGGTGFYINALIYGVETVNIPPNEKLREDLENKTVDELSNILQKQNYKKYNSMNDSDKKNKRRLIRAIEVYEYQKANYPLLKDSKLEGYDILTIGLKGDKDVIKERINNRVTKRIEQGAFEEAENLYKNYDKLSSSVKNANGYKQLFEYFKGIVSKEGSIENWRKAEYYNAKKQMTWFRKDRRVEWFDIEADNFLQNINDRLSYFLP